MEQLDEADQTKDDAPDEESTTKNDLDQTTRPELPIELSFLKIQIPTDKFLPSPKPWQQTVEISSPPPPPPQTDFNRCAKGFVRSFISPYRHYRLGRMEETCDL